MLELIDITVGKEMIKTQVLVFTKLQWGQGLIRSRANFNLIFISYSASFN